MTTALTILSIVIPSLSVVVAAYITNSKVGKVHKVVEEKVIPAVETGNAQTVGALVAIAHGRDINIDSQPDERSESDQHYVDLYDQDRQSDE